MLFNFGFKNNNGAILKLKSANTISISVSIDSLVTFGGVIPMMNIDLQDLDLFLQMLYHIYY